MSDGRFFLGRLLLAHRAALSFTCLAFNAQEEELLGGEEQCVCMCVCMCVCICVCMYVCMYGFVCVSFRVLVSFFFFLWCPRGNTNREEDHIIYMLWQGSREVFRNVCRNVW